MKTRKFAHLFSATILVDATRCHQRGRFRTDPSTKRLFLRLNFLMQSKPAPRGRAHGGFGECDWRRATTQSAAPRITQL